AENVAHTDIGARIAYLQDDTRQLQVNQAMADGQPWMPVARTSPNFGFTNNAYWFRFALDNQTGKPVTRFIELPRPFLDDVRLFHFVDGRIITRYSLGDEQPFVQRVMQHQNFVMPLNLEPGRNQVVLRIASTGTVEAPLRLWQPAAFYEAASKENLLAGAVFGMLLVMIVYNLFVFLSTRVLHQFRRKLPDVLGHLEWLCLCARLAGGHPLEQHGCALLHRMGLPVCQPVCGQLPEVVPVFAASP
ncbi:MAG: hypothetical protein EBR58_12395, partial [Betaproteobacteria bacterium]|nr:hypothetical protein [Betaproteobacteria bacterium]